MVAWKQRRKTLHLSIILFGEEWTGRSSAANTILGRAEFPVDGTIEPLTLSSGFFEDRYVTVVNTPGWEPECAPNVPLRILKRGCGRVSWDTGQGPHALLLTVSICLNMEQNQKVAKRLLKLFDDNVWRHTILLFTRADLLGSTSLEKYLEGSGRPFQALVEKCERRYHALDNQKMDNREQVNELLTKIEDTVAENFGKTFQIEEETIVEHQTEAPRQTEPNVKQACERVISLSEDECLSHATNQGLIVSSNEDCEEMQNFNESDSDDRAEELTMMEQPNLQGFDPQNGDEEYADSEDKDHPEAIETEIGAVERAANKTGCSGPAMMDAYEDIFRQVEEAQEDEDNQLQPYAVLNTPQNLGHPSNGTESLEFFCSHVYNQQGAVRIHVLQIFICWRNLSLFCEATSISFVVCYVRIDWSFFVIQCLLVMCLYLQNKIQKTILVAKEPKKCAENETMVGFPMHQQHPTKEKQQVGLRVGDQPGNLDGEMLQLNKTEDTEEIPQHSRISDWVPVDRRAHENEGIPQDYLRANDAVIPQHSRKSDDEGLPEHDLSNENISRHDSKKSNDDGTPQLHRKKDDKEVPQHSRSKDNNGGIPQHKGDGTSKQNRKKGDDGIPLCNKKFDGEIPKPSRRQDTNGGPQHNKKKGDEAIAQCTKKIDGEILKLSRRKDANGRPQHNKKKDDVGFPQCNKKSDGEIPKPIRRKAANGRPQDNKKKDGGGFLQCKKKFDGEIPKLSRRKNANGKPQQNKKKSDGGILQNCRKEEDKDIRQCCQQKREGGITRQQGKVDDKGVSQHCRKKNEGTPRHSMKKDDLGIHQQGISHYSKKETGEGMPQENKKKGDLGTPQQELSQYSKKKNDEGIPQFIMEGYDGGLPQHQRNRDSRKKVDRGRPSHRMKKDDRRKPQYNRKDNDRQNPQHSKKSDSDEISELGNEITGAENKEELAPRESYPHPSEGRHQDDTGDTERPAQGVGVSERGHLGCDLTSLQTDFGRDRQYGEKLMVRREKPGRSRKLQRSQSMDHIVSLRGVEEEDMGKEEIIRMTRRSKSLQRFIKFTVSPPVQAVWMKEAHLMG